MSIFFRKHSKVLTYAATVNFSLTIFVYYDGNDDKMSTNINSCYLKTTEEYNYETINTHLTKKKIL